MMEDRWWGGEGSKRQEVNNKGGPPSLHRPPRPVRRRPPGLCHHWSKERSFGGGLRVIIYNLLQCWAHARWNQSVSQQVERRLHEAEDMSESWGGRSSKFAVNENVSFFWSILVSVSVSSALDRRQITKKTSQDRLYLSSNKIKTLQL